MTVVDLYTIQVINIAGGEPLSFTPLLDAIMQEAEQNISDLLPFGYVAKVRRWNDPDPDERNDPDE